MFARVATYQIPANRLGDAARSFEGAMDEIQGIGGFRDGYVLVDADDGRALTMTVWESRNAVEMSRDTAGRLRRSAAKEADGTVISVVEYEVALHAQG